MAALPQPVHANRTPTYTIKGGVVYLSGGLRQPLSDTSDLVAVLPKAARPAHEMFLTVHTAYGVGRVVIKSNGEMLAGATPQSSAQLFTSLAAISYPAAGATWHTLALSNGWKASPNPSDPKPAYAIISGVVYLSGILDEPTGTSTLFAALPSAARPAHNLYAPVDTSGGTFGAVSIVPGLGMFANSQPFSNAQTFTSLAGISYPRNS